MGINRDLPLRFRRITDNNAQIILTLGAGAVEVFEHGWGDFPSHSWESQGKILEAIKGVRGHGSGEGERTGESVGRS